MIVLPSRWFLANRLGFVYHRNIYVRQVHSNFQVNDTDVYDVCLTAMKTSIGARRLISYHVL